MMRAAVLRDGAVVVRDDVPDPVPGLGQVLVEVKACGICGSDLHFVRHGPTMLELAAELRGVPDVGRVPPDLSRDVFMGHEFAAEVLEVGPDTVGPAPGTLVTSVPVMVTTTGVQDLVYSNDLPAGYAERMLLCAPLVETVPAGVDPTRAALTEPLAVGLHAVNLSGVEERSAAVVVGCGPVGVAVIAALRRRGIEPVVASDFSAGRRGLAATMGAHRTVDPASEDVFEVVAEAAGGRSLVVFEAVGVPGTIDEILRHAPPRSRIVVVGVCMGKDTVTPLWAITKELSVQFAFGYDPTEFSAALAAIGDGAVDVGPMITGEVGLDRVPWAFEELGRPERHCKILVVP